MSAIGCSEFLNRIDDWLDGRKSFDSLDHFRSCPDCRGLVGDLGAIQNAAQSLASADLEVEPPARLWTSLRAQLEQEGLIREQRTGWLAGLAGWLHNAADFTPRPALAGAYLLLLFTLGFALGRPIDSQLNATRWARNTADSTNTLSAQLDTAEQDAVSEMSDARSAVLASLHENLAIVDNDISLCEKSVREEPENEAARDYLYEAYQQKADLLAQISERGER